MLGRQQLGLERVRLDGREIRQHIFQPGRLGGGNGVGIQRYVAVFTQKFKALLGEIGVEYHSVGALEPRQPAAKIVRRQPGGDAHVGNGGVQLAAALAQIEIGRGAQIAHGQTHRQIESELAAAAAQRLAEEVLAEGGDQADLGAEQVQVVGNVAPHAARAQVDDTGVGIMETEVPGGTSADIHIGAAYDNDGRTHAITCQILRAYSMMARSAANTPLLAVFTMARRPSSCLSAMLRYRRPWHSA